MANVSGADEGLATEQSKPRLLETYLHGLSLYGTHSRPADPSSEWASEECLTLYFALSSRGHTSIEERSFRITTVTLKVILCETERAPRSLSDLGPIGGHQEGRPHFFAVPSVASTWWPLVGPRRAAGQFLKALAGAWIDA